METVKGAAKELGKSPGTGLGAGMMMIPPLFQQPSPPAGAPAAALIICPKCKTQIPSTSKFCPDCGSSVATPPMLSDKQIKTMVLGYIRDQGGELDLDECADELGLTAEQVEKAIRILKKEGKLEDEE